MAGASDILAQVALTVSPFVSLPSATTLPYTYRALPTALPPSSTADRAGSRETSRPAFVISASGQAAHPDDIQTSCRKLQVHLQRVREDANSTFGAWTSSLKERELAEKRRVAPGWLDRDEKILQPERTSVGSPSAVRPGELQSHPQQAQQLPSKQTVNPDTAEGQELDRAFGPLEVL